MMNMGLSCRKGDSRQGTNLNKGQEARVWWDLEVVTHPIRLEQSLWGGE